MSPLEVSKLMKEGAKIQVIDVREPFEYELINIGGLNLPLSSLREKTDLIEKEIPVVVLCKSGQRSTQAIRLLQPQGFTNLINMKGGLMAWRDEVDGRLKLY